MNLILGLHRTLLNLKRDGNRCVCYRKVYSSPKHKTFGWFSRENLHIFLGKLFSWENYFPGKIIFPWKSISHENHFPGKIIFLGKSAYSNNLNFTKLIRYVVEFRYSMSTCRNQKLLWHWCLITAATLNSKD